MNNVGTNTIVTSDVNNVCNYCLEIKEIVGGEEYRTIKSYVKALSTGQAVIKGFWGIHVNECKWKLFKEIEDEDGPYNIYIDEGYEYGCNEIEN